MSDIPTIGPKWEWAAVRAFFRALCTFNDGGKVIRKKDTKVGKLTEAHSLEVKTVADLAPRCTPAARYYLERLDRDPDTCDLDLQDLLIRLEGETQRITWECVDMWWETILSV